MDYVLAHVEGQNETSDCVIELDGLGLEDDVNLDEEGVVSETRVFFRLLRALPADLKRYIISLLMGNAARSCYDYSLTLQSDYKISAPAMFSPDGKTVLVTSYPKNIFGLSTITSTSDAQLFDLSSGKMKFRFKGPSNPSFALHRMVFSNDGALVVIASFHTLSVLDAATGTVLKEVKCTGLILSLCPDGRKCILQLEQYYLLHIDLENLAKVETEQEAVPLNWDAVRSYYRIQFSPNGNFLYIMYKCGFWDGNTGAFLNVLNDHLVIAVSPDGSKIAGLNMNSSTFVDLIDASTFRSIGTVSTSGLSDERGLILSSCEFSADNSLLLLVSDDDNEDGIFHVYDGETGKPIYKKHGLFPKFTYGGLIVAVGQHNGSKLFFMEARTGTLIRVMCFPSEIRRSALSHMDSTMITTHVMPSPVSASIFVGLEYETQVVSCQASYSVSRATNRTSPNDSSWMFFMSLYRLFYMPEIENAATDLNLDSLSLFSSENEVFISFRDPSNYPLEDASNEEQICDSGFGWKSLVGAFLLILLLPLYPVLAPIVIITFCCCDIRGD